MTLGSARISFSAASTAEDDRDSARSDSKRIPSARFLNNSDISDLPLFYLLGQGLYDRKSRKITRPAWASGQTFTLEFRLRDPLDRDIQPLKFNR